MEKGKKEIIRRFHQDVKGKKSNTKRSNTKHSGKEGHWLEKKMGIKRNASNSPDLFGYEMKNHTGSKTSFGDWSASFYIWHDKKYNIVRNDFIRIFGKPNLKKDGRYSWSGEPVPKINKYNSFGQILFVDRKGNIVIEYSFTNDQRINKRKVVPASMQVENLVLARWDRDWISGKLESKFNQKGWFKCLRNADKIYTEIVFGEPMNYKNWLKGVKSGLIFFDSGMYETNTRNYSQWRANNAYWDKLIVERY